MIKKIKKAALLILGFSAVLLGFIGIFIPILPTTPFLLLAAFCFLRSSNRLYFWLSRNKILGKFIHDYVKYRMIPLKSKIIAILFLWLSIGTSVLLVKNLHLTFILLTIGICVMIHLILLKTSVKKDKNDGCKTAGLNYE